MNSARGASKTVLDIRDLDKKTMLDGFCTRPSPESLKSYRETGTSLEQALGERRRFLTDRLDQGTVWGKIAYQGGEPVGWVDCFPSGAEGWTLVGCIAVETGAGGRGVGRALMQAVLEHAREQGALGLTVGATVWEHMPKTFFARYGFVDTDPKANMSRMVLKLQEGPVPEFPPRENRYRPQLVPGTVVIDLIRTGNCPVPYHTHDLVKQAAARFGDKVVVNEYASNEKEVVERFGKGGCGTYFNGEPAFFGYPGTLADIVKHLEKKVSELGD